MKKINPFVVLSALVVSFWFAGLVLAAPKNEEEVNPLTLPFQTSGKALESTIFNLGQIYVTGSRVSAPASDEMAANIPGEISILGADFLETTPTASLAESLSRLDTVTYSDDIGGGENARVDLRGFGGEAKQALVLFDGLRAVEPFDNSMSWHLFPQEFMRQVEVQPGGSAIYGEGALSGTIRMATKEPTEQFKATTENAYGSFATHRHFVEGSGTAAGLGVYTSARYLSTKGYRQNADQEAASFLIKAKRKISEFLEISNAFFFADDTTGIPGPLSAAEVAQNRRQKDPEGQFGDHFKDKLVQDGLTLTYLLEPAGIELSNLTGYRFRNQDSLQSFGGFFPGRSINDIETETFSDVIQASRALENSFIKSLFTAGAEFSKDDIHNPFTFEDFTFGPFSSERSIDRRMLGFFAQNHSTFWDRLVVEAAGRYDRVDWDIYDLKSPELQKRKFAERFSPSAGIQYRFLPEWRLYGSYAESFKVPDANTLIFETPNIFLPNPSIDPSMAYHYEAGVRYQASALSAKAGFFLIQTKKEILFNDITNLNENFDTVRQGLSLSGNWSVLKGLDLFAHYTHAAAEFDGGVYDGRDIPMVPRNRAAVGFTASPVKNWTVSSQAVIVRDQFALNDFNNLFPVPNYWTMDARVAYRRGPWEIYFKADNLFGREYSSFMTSDGTVTVNYNPSPGRYIEGGFRLEL